MTRRLRAMSDLPVILVSASTSVEDRLSGFSVGGDDFIVKPFSMAEMLMRVEALLRRANHGTSSVIEVGDIRIDVRAHVATRAGPVLPLRTLEYKLLLTFCRHSGRSSKAQLLGAVWGFALRRQPGRGPRQPPRASSRSAAARVIQTVRSVGYVLDPSSASSDLLESADLQEIQLGDGVQRHARRAPTTVPLILMYCRSGPSSSSSRRDVSSESHRLIVPVISSAISPWKCSAT